MDMMFRDTWNPTEAEIETWAFSPDALWPEEDWDLALIWPKYWRQCLRLADDRDCPHRRVFLSVVYLVVGGKIRSGVNPASTSAVNAILEEARGLESPEINLWRERSIELLGQPELFSYPDWCEGRFARETL